MLEHCYRCLSDAPGEDAWESADWLVLLKRAKSSPTVQPERSMPTYSPSLVEPEALYEIAA